MDDVKLSEDQGKVVVKLHWKKPDQTHGTLKGFRVTYGKKGAPKDQTIVKEMEPGDEFISIEGLSKRNLTTINGMKHDLTLEHVSCYCRSGYSL